MRLYGTSENVTDIRNIPDNREERGRDSKKLLHVLSIRPYPEYAFWRATQVKYPER